MIPAEYGPELTLVCMAAWYGAGVLKGDLEIEAASLPVIEAAGGHEAVVGAMELLISALEPAPGSDAARREGRK